MGSVLLRGHIFSVTVLVLALFLLACPGPVSPPDDDMHDDQEHFEWQLIGLEHEEILAVAIDPINDGTMYAGSRGDFDGTIPGGLFKSVNGGADWDTLFRGSHVMDIEIHSANSQILYILSRQIMKSVDGGETWFTAETGIYRGESYTTPTILAINPLHPDTLFTGTGGPYGGGMYRSTDGGQSWYVACDSTLYGGVRAIAIDPHDSQTVYAGTLSTGVISKSVDGGNSWQRMDIPELGISYLLVDLFDSANIYAGVSRNGVYYSPNHGADWVAACSGFQGNFGEVKLAMNAERIYAATCGQDTSFVYYSPHDELHWKIVGNHGFRWGVNAIATHPTTGELYVGSIGVFKLVRMPTP
jgi:photosystem II stability/assembly factor-like uncharacterized protein